MRTLRTATAGSLCLGGMLLAASTAFALPPITKTVEVDPQTRPAVAAESYVPGMPVVVVLNDKSRLTGTVVYADDAADYVLVRTAPRTLPRKIMGKDIAEVNRIQAAALQPRKDEGPSVRPAMPSEEIPAPAAATYAPEIGAVTIYNGPVRTVKYIAPTLSSPELTLLERLESAENELARVRNAATVANQFIANARALDDARTEALSRHYSAIPLYITDLSVYYAEGYGYGGGYGFGYRPWYGAFGHGAYGFGTNSHIVYPPNPTAGETDTQVVKAAAAQILATDMSPETLARAESAVSMARSYVITDDDGRVVALRPEAVDNLVRGEAAPAPQPGVTPAATR